MGLYVRDETVNALADRLAKATGKTKTEAVREALIARIAEVAPLSAAAAPAWLAEVQAQARALGFVRDPNWTEADDKAFMDDLSGGI